MNRLSSFFLQPSRLWLSLLGVVGALASSPLYSQGLTPREKFFEDRVRPLLLDQCQECHSAEIQESNLRLDSRAAILQGGLSGAAAKPRDPDASLIIKAVLGEDGMEPMPPGEPLDEESIAVLQRWVTMGLPWTADDQPAVPSLGDQEAIRAVAENHWAFQPITHGKLPRPADPEWAANPIDAFIRTRLEEYGLQPSPPVDRRTLIRRIRFDVTGLPPTPAETEAFVMDPASDDMAIAALVDRLLTTEQYAERWARHWLDLARYADTRDWQAQTEIRYPYAYTYRDYVIRSLHEDKPFDTFVREQLAADALFEQENAPELAALGFLTVGPRFRNNRAEQVADQIDVVTRGLMGLTVSCARCHDHKYDPVPIEDYYSLYGVFASCNIPNQLPTIKGTLASAELTADFEQKIAAKRREVTQYGVNLRKSAIADLRRDVLAYMAGYYDMTLTKKIQIRGILTKHKVKEFAMTPFAEQLDRRVRAGQEKSDPVLGPLMQTCGLSEQEFAKQSTDLRERWRSDPTLNPIVQASLQKVEPETRVQVITAYGSIFQDVLRQWAEYRKASPEAERLPEQASESLRAALLEPGGLFDLEVNRVVAAARLLGGARKIQGDLEKAVTEVEATHPGAPPRAMVMEDNDKPTTPFVFLRGEPTRRGDRVPRQFLSILAGEQRKPFKSGSGRRELADAIVARDNPLTSRLFVNRVWSRYFGAGLAVSLDDFGLRSEPPSHPELLDELAWRFMQDGWSMKALHRTILTSRTYRQSCAGNSDATKIDPENRLLWRQNRRRLDFEAMRDALLAVSGSLDLTVGGRSVPLSATPFTQRRTLYAYVDRVEMDPMLRTFDFASPYYSSASRPETTVPQQALFAMNHPFVAYCARQLAASVERSATSADTEAIVTALYRDVLGRLPTEREQQLAMAFVADVDALEPVSAGTVWQYGYGPVERTASQRPFTALPFYTGSAYQIGAEFPDPQLGHLRATASGGHPGRNGNHALILRWIAPSAGTIEVRGAIKHLRDSGDGINVRWQLPGGNVQSPKHVFNASSPASFSDVHCQPGDVLECIVDCNERASSDAFQWEISIEGTTGSLAGKTWDVRSGFGPPPPPPLMPLEQLSQAMLLSNEFLFLD